MSDNRCFVQFSHPGGEHKPDRDCMKAWLKLEHDHMRKFMQLRGQWIDENGNRQTGELHAWGEWEPESEVVARLNPPDGDPRYPRYLWRPFYVPKEDYRGLRNTDPFIFGERFLYSNCGQTKPGLRCLDRGSVIAFGSGKTIDGEKRWMLDTVLVVSDFVDYDQPKVRTALRGWVPDGFLDVVGGPLAANAAGIDSRTCASTDARTRLRLYRGATHNDRVDGMFSFFPALPPADGDAGFQRPLVDLPSEYFNAAASRGPKGIRRNRESGELRDLWEQLVAQVKESGLVIGTRAELPERLSE